MNGAKRSGRGVLKDEYIIRCVKLENDVREKDREIERLNAELSNDGTDGPLYVFGMVAAAIAGGIVGCLGTLVFRYFTR